MTINVNFYDVVAKDGQTAAERFEAMTKESTAFYIVGSNAYLGDKKLTNGADLASAIADIAENASDIADIQSQITTWSASASTEGSIAKMIADAINELDGTLADVAKSGNAEDVAYDNTTSGLTATDVQAALDELAESSAGTNGAVVFKGTVQTLPTSASKGDAYIVGGKLSVCTTASTTSPTWTELAINSVITGSGYQTEGATGVDPTELTIKQYIDKLIFVGTQAEYNSAKAAGTLLANTFAVITDENAEQFIPITTAEITALF